MYSALAVPSFRSVKLRTRRATCPACGPEGKKVGQIEDVDYVALCGGRRPDWVARGLISGKTGDRIHAKVRIAGDDDAGLTGIQELKIALEDGERRAQVLDVRPSTEFGICHLPGSISGSPVDLYSPLANLTLVCRCPNQGTPRRPFELGW